MEKIWVFLALLAVTSAAPSFSAEELGPRPRFPPPRGPYHSPPPRRLPYNSEEVFGDEVFDTHRFWSDLEAQMQHMEDILRDFNTRFHSKVNTEGERDNKYIITISLAGFDEKDIVVKAREGVLMVQAVHKTEGGSDKYYMDLRTLPLNINVEGSWTYDNEVLKIEFPLLKKSDDGDVQPTAIPTTTTTEATTEQRSREEMEENSSADVPQNADVGLERGDSAKNEVEATTYAVDLTNEIEFVPVKY